MNLPNYQKQQSGFTIVELMIATAIFTVVLLLCTFGLLHIGRTYYKGITVSQTQNRARAIMDDVSQAVQFSGLDVNSTPARAPGDIESVCVGNKRYTYVIARQLDDNPSGTYQSKQVLTWDTNRECRGPKDWNQTDFTEILGQHMRLADFSITAVNGVDRMYVVKVRIVYGDDDLLCSPAAADCQSTATSNNLDAADLTCKTGVGSQFCAVSDLSTTVLRRIM